MPSSSSKATAASSGGRGRAHGASPGAGLPEQLTELRGVGPALAERLGRLEIFRPIDLLFLLPQRYEDRTRLTPLGAARPGQRCVVEGEVALAEIVYRRRRQLLARIADGTGQLTLRFFYFSRAQQQQLASGARVRCYGEVRPGPAGLEMVHPEYRVLAEGHQAALEERLTPVYPTVEGIAQFRLRGLIAQMLDRHLSKVRDWLPAGSVAKLDLPTLAAALELVHRPPPGCDLASLAAGAHPAQRRLALEEMLGHHLSLRELRQQARSSAAEPLPVRDPERRRFLGTLGFRLTAGQAEALADIDRDLAQPHPMMRLLQGDVGCGKTVVAAAAAINAVANGCQAAIMAPTELLAEQHRASFTRWLEPLGIRVAWLTGSLARRAREAALGDIAAGSAAVVVGTHALFQDGVEYHKLGLVVVDEQHRFGVHQRLRLMEKGAAGGKLPHQLVMTATPIPRTLAMTMYADLDTTVIRELPPGRQPVRTVALPERRRPEVVERVREAVRTGRRAYWVCPLIEESEVLPSQAAESTAAALAEALPEIRVGLLHGRMPATAKEEVMSAFARGEVQLLVATTVIEVGVDVPAATLMIIENAERLGLSQLHQLRGRVGRGADTSSCVLLYRSPLSAMAKERLEVLRRTTDGFEVAQRDLELRGPGEVLGTRQTGLLRLRVADLIRDAELLPAVQRLAGDLLAADPAAARALIERWVGSSARYGAV